MCRDLCVCITRVTTGRSHIGRHHTVPQDFSPEEDNDDAIAYASDDEASTCCGRTHTPMRRALAHVCVCVSGGHGE